MQGHVPVPPQSHFPDGAGAVHRVRRHPGATAPGRAAARGTGLGRRRRHRARRLRRRRRLGADAPALLQGDGRLHRHLPRHRRGEHRARGVVEHTVSRREGASCWTKTASLIVISAWHHGKFPPCVPPFVDQNCEERDWVEAQSTDHPAVALAGKATSTVRFEYWYASEVVQPVTFQPTKMFAGLM